MKKALLFVVLALLGSTTISLAGEAVYYPSSGRVNIPQLTVAGDPSGTVYNVDLHQRSETTAFDLAGVSLAISAPAKFTKEWLAGKTLFSVYFGEGNSNGMEVFDVPVVEKCVFYPDGTVYITGLLNEDTVHSTYRVDDNGRLFFGDDTDEWNEIVCDSTDRYIKTHLYEGGQLDNVELLYFDENAAMSAAEFLTKGFPKCPSAP